MDEMHVHSDGKDGHMESLIVVVVGSMILALFLGGY